MAASTQFDDDSIRSAAATLATFRSVHGATFRDAVKLAADYAALSGNDVTSAAQTIGMALEGQRRGVLKLTKAQDEQIKTLKEQGRAAEAQGVVMDALKGKFGGLAEAMNTGLTQSTTCAAKAWDELAEALGKTEKASGGVNALLKLSALAMEELTKQIDQATAAKVRLDGKLSELPKPPPQPQPAALPGPVPRTTNNLLTEMSAEEYKAKSGALLVELDRKAAATKAARDKEELSALEARSVAANKLKEIHDQMYDAVLTPQEKYFARLKEIAEVERVYGEEVAGRAAQKAGEQFIAEQAATPEGKQSAREEAERASFDAAQAEQQAQAATRLAEIETSLQTENERIEAAYSRRLLMVEAARQTNFGNEQKYHELSTQLWAQAEAEKSAIAMREAEQREQRDATEFQNKMRWADMSANLLGSFASLSEGRGKSAFETSQRLARAQTIVSTASAAMKAFAWGAEWGGPPAGAAAAAVAVAAGLAQLNKINETKYSGGGSIATATGGGAGGSVPGTSGGGVSSQGTTASPARNGGVTNIAIAGSENSTFSYGQVTRLIELINEATLRGDQVLLSTSGYNAQLIKNMHN